MAFEYLPIMAQAGAPKPPRVLVAPSNPAFLHRDGFNPLDFFAGERELFGLEVFFHMLLARGSGQREHPDLHGKAKDDLRGTGT